MNASNTSISRVAGGKSFNELFEDSDIKASDLIDQVAYNDKIKYHEFTDTTTQTHEYDTDNGEDEREWFLDHSNYDSLIDDMDGMDENAFRAWTRGSFMDGQQYGGFSNMTDTEQNRTRVYDKYVDQSVVDEGITLSRRATAELLGLSSRDNPSLSQLKRMKGKLIVSKGSMSTAAAKDGLTIGATYSEKPIEYKVHIPGGAKGAGMWLGDKRINGWGPEQREYMTNRDSVYVIGDSTTKKVTTDSWLYGKSTHEVKVVHIYYLGRLPHDYT